MITRLQVRHGSCHDGSHTGGGSNTGFPAFQCSQAILEHADGGISKARINKTGFGIRKTQLRLFSTIKAKARS